MRNHGFTLIETIVYVTILALISVVAVRLVLAVSINTAEIRSERKIISNGELALETLIREIRQASAIAISPSVLGTSPGTLVLTTIASPGSSVAVTRTFSLSGSRLSRQDDSNPSEFITSSDVSITQLTFWHAATTTSSLITIQLTLEAGQGRFKESKSFYGSAVLRSGY